MGYPYPIFCLCAFFIGDHATDEPSAARVGSLSGVLIWEFPKIRGTLFWGPYNKGATI